MPRRRPAPVLGVDGCRGSWLAARVVGDERSARLTGWQLGRFAEVLVGAEPVEVVAVDIPVGLLPAGRRACDEAGRRVLGGAAASRLFLVPPRYAIEAPSYGTANDLLRARGEPAVSRQTYALARAVLEVDAVADDPRVHEVHPELSFLAMTGRVLPTKHSAVGIAERTAALAGWLDVNGALATAPMRAKADDVLDALAAAWTATRIQASTAASYPEQATDPLQSIKA